VTTPLARGRLLCSACNGGGRRRFFVRHEPEPNWADPAVLLSSFSTPRLWCWHCEGTGYVRPRPYPRAWGSLLSGRDWQSNPYGRCT
jgi:hypothetical protein